jgi:cytochrome P450 family 12
MKNLRNEKSEMPGNFNDYLNQWSLESIALVAVERRLNILSGSSNDENAKELIKNIRKFFELSVEFEGKVSVWRLYETKQFKELMDVYEKMTKYDRIKL